MNITAYLRELDDDIARHRAAIREHQIAIQELEDTRVVLMRREELKAYVNGHASPFGTLPNGASIVARDPIVAAHRALPEVTAPPALAPPLPDDPEARRREVKRIANAKYNAKKRELAGKRPALVPGRPLKPDSLQSRVRALLRSDPRRVFDTGTIMDRLGIENRPGIGGAKQRQQVHQALYQLRLEGSAERLDAGTYQFKQNPPA